MQLLAMLLTIAAAYLLFRVGRYLLNHAGRPGKRAKLPNQHRRRRFPRCLRNSSASPHSGGVPSLAKGEPRNAIVATWLDLEESLGASASLGGPLRRRGSMPLE